MEGIMVEFILWTDNPKTDIDKISHYIGIQPIEKKRMGEMRYIGPNKNIEKINEESSLLYSTDYIKTVEVEHAMPKMIDMLKPNMKNIISVIFSKSLSYLTSTRIMNTYKCYFLFSSFFIQH